MIEILVALNITNDENYSLYRKGMTPLLNAVGGGFGYDFKIDQVLKAECDHPINRVFTINFPSNEVMKSFFSDPKYLEIKEEFFKGSVSDVTRVSTYEKSM